jgi:hypothetical protein
LYTFQYTDTHLHRQCPHRILARLWNSPPIPNHNNTLPHPHLLSLPLLILIILYTVPDLVFIQFLSPAPHASERLHNSIAVALVDCAIATVATAKRSMLRCMNVVCWQGWGDREKVAFCVGVHKGLSRVLVMGVFALAFWLGTGLLVKGLKTRWEISEPCSGRP